MGRARISHSSGNDMSAQRRSPRYALLWPALIVLLLLSLHFFNPAQRGLWTQVFYNSLHVPVFGAIGIAVFMIVRNYAAWPPSRRILIAVFAVMIISIVSEAAQIPGSRDASLEDLIADWLGATSFVLLAIAVNTWRNGGRTRSIAVALAGTALLSFALADLTATSLAYVERRLRLPTLASFDSYLGNRFMRLQNAKIEISPAPDGGGSRAKIGLRKNAWPGVEFHDIWPDWSSYTTLVVELEAIGAEPLQLNIRAHDRHHRTGDQPYSDRFNMRLTLLPVPQVVRIPLADIASAPKGRRMNLTQMHSVMIFGSKEAQGRQFWLSEIRLE